MFTHTSTTRIRYADTDKMGYLYYGRYATLYEIGRVEAMRSLGLTYKEMEDVWGVAMPVMSLHSRYIRPVYYDEVIRIETSIRALPDQSITFYNSLYNIENELVNSAEVKLCFIEINSKKRIPVPDAIIQQLKPYF